MQSWSGKNGDIVSLDSSKIFPRDIPKIAIADKFYFALFSD